MDANLQRAAAAQLFNRNEALKEQPAPGDELGQLEHSLRFQALRLDTAAFVLRNDVQTAHQEAEQALGHLVLAVTKLRELAGGAGDPESIQITVTVQK